MKLPIFLLLAVAAVVPATIHAMPIGGVVLNSASGSAIAGARVTLFTPDLQFFRETRTDAGGAFQLSLVGSGSYHVDGGSPCRRCFTPNRLSVGILPIFKSSNQSS